MTSEYQVQLGERLRAIRNQQGLTLQEVEERSGGEWKAVVVGSYERGDRAVSVSKLARLADFYGVPVGDLLPDVGNGERPGPPRSRVVLDLTQLPSVGDAGPGAVGALARYVRRIQLQRGDYNGRTMTLRERDLEAVAIVAGVRPEELTEELKRRSALAAAS